MIIVPLSGQAWAFREVATQRWRQARVPGCVHTDLIAHQVIPDPFYGTNELGVQWVGERDWEYQCQFQISQEAIDQEAIELVAEGLDTVATIELNGRAIATSDNMFVIHRWDIRKHARAGRNRLRIRFASAAKYIRDERRNFTPPREYCDPVGNAVRIRKQPSQFGWDWGPRLITAGIWRDIRVEAWSTNRVDQVHLRQRHVAEGVWVTVSPQLARPAKACSIEVSCSLEGTIISRKKGNESKLNLLITDPRLWWPAGQGEQPLYTLSIAVVCDGVALPPVKRTIGLRTITLDRHADQWGESFQFVVNGRPIFAKGANWVPAHSFVASLTRDHYARDLSAAVAANMNCIRVWGGGIYESEDFYDLCDELGLLVWQDFMFSCALYPTDAAFMASVQAEATCQVQRLQHRACLALWCGNNELAQLNMAFLNEQPELKAGYVRLFHELLPDVVKACDGVTAYWPSSEWRGEFASGHHLGEKSGDSHYWDVWHARHPVKDYEKWAFRFCSEFGMQSYSSPATNLTFCPEADRNIFGPSMENHQKNREGNQVILYYVSLRYRFPNSQENLIYLSQLNQAYCMQVGVEHYRRLMPRCMGALYWQLNDCWPVASWSSIEHTGRWKALHYTARRFNAPALATAYIVGDEFVSIGNYRHTSVDRVQLYTVYDHPESDRGMLRWELRKFSGQVIRAGAKKVSLRYGESVCQKTLSLAGDLARHGRDSLYLRLSLHVGHLRVSDRAIFLAPPRFASLSRGKPELSLQAIGKDGIQVTLRSKVFLHGVMLDLQGSNEPWSDNVFDLFPDEAKTVTLHLARPTTLGQIRRRLRVHSLVDTYD